MKRADDSRQREFIDRRRDESGWPEAFVLDSKTAGLNKRRGKERK